MLPSRDPGESVDPELADDFTQVFVLLLEHGADSDRVEPTLSRSMSDCYGASLVGAFLGRSPAV